MTVEYKIKAGQEAVPADAKVVEKFGEVTEFQMATIKSDLMSFDKVLLEAKSNRAQKQAVIDNVAQHHPFVVEIPEADRVAVLMYQENISMVRAFDKKIAQLEKQKADYEEEVAAILAALPELAPVVSPMQPKKCKAEECETTFTAEGEGAPEYCPAHQPSQE